MRRFSGSLRLGIRPLTRWLPAALRPTALLLLGGLLALPVMGEPTEPSPSPMGDTPAVVAAATLNRLTPTELADGWISLFDGESLFGWQPTSNANWEVADGAIRVSQGDPGFLVTTSDFADFQLHLEFRSPLTTNSGIFLRSSPEPTDPAADCYELNIASPAESPFPTGSLVARQRTDAYQASDQWQQCEILALGGYFLIKINGRTTLEYTDPRPLARGRIGLQFRTGEVTFRNVKLKPLRLQPLFNGQDLSGWKTYPEMVSRFSVTPEGELHVADGPGQLESEAQLADFILQMQVRTGGEQLNSGIFFRCIPGEKMNGYECQIHNGYQEGDRSQPVDGGTGGFYRRQEARRVMADDFTWFPLTLVVSGPHMAAWVNGVQVSDWTDTRPPDANPRRGLRTAAGTLMIQGHDPTTDILFRQIRAAEMPR